MSNHFIVCVRFAAIAYQQFSIICGVYNLYFYTIVMQFRLSNLCELEREVLEEPRTMMCTLDGKSLVYSSMKIKKKIGGPGRNNCEQSKKHFIPKCA